MALTFVPAVNAHQASDAYLQASVADGGEVELRIDVALRDLDVLLELDANADGQLNWGEVRQREAEIGARVQAALRVTPERCALHSASDQPLLLDRKADGTYARLQFASPCQASEPIQLAYSLMEGIDPTHRGLLQAIDGNAKAGGSLVSLRPGGAAVSLTAREGHAADAPTNAPPDASPNALHSGGFFADGLRHIWAGADHILFLVCLILPLVLGRGGAHGSARDVGRSLLMLVTAFTVGHSSTLALASFRWVAVPSSVIEPLIAATIAIAAADNLRPFLGHRRALAALTFGLIHGFGFAGPLLEIDLSPSEMAWSLLQFNLGVEAGQLMVVGASLLLLWPLRERGAWARRTVSLASIAAGVMAVAWFTERVFNARLMPF